MGGNGNEAHPKMLRGCSLCWTALLQVFEGKDETLEFTLGVIVNNTVSSGSRSVVCNLTFKEISSL